MMNTTRIRTIIDKEWVEVFKNKMVLFTIVLLPVLFTLMPLGFLYFANYSDMMSAGGDVSDVPAMFTQACGSLPAADCLQYFVLNQFLIMFMMLPLIIPTAIAAYSIVGEKTNHSLEPLLATPITTMELLTGKALAAALPAVLVTWACFFIFVLLMPLVGTSRTLVAQVLSPTWLVAVLIIGPLIAVASVNLAVIISSRVNDPRAAEQISAVLIMPLLALLFGQLAGLIVINITVMLISTLVILLLDVGLLYIGTQLFQRENILTRWK